MLRQILPLIASMLLGWAATAVATPNGQSAGQSAVIPFDPPLDETLRYRTERWDTKDGRTTINWSTDNYRFDKAGSGYRLTIEPIGSGSNEDDPRMKLAMAELEGLMRRPFVLSIDEEGQITGVDQAEEYWAGIISGMRKALASGRQTPDTAKLIGSVVGLFEAMPAEVRLSKLTEGAQPLVEFANTSTTIGKPIRQQIETASPFGGTLKQDVAVSLTGIKDGTASLVVRSSIPRAELERLTTAFVTKMAEGSIKAEDRAKMSATIAAMKSFKSETVSEYQIRLDDGMLETFQATQTITAGGGKPSVRTKVTSMKRVH